MFFSPLRHRDKKSRKSENCSKIEILSKPDFLEIPPIQFSAIRFRNDIGSSFLWALAKVEKNRWAIKYHLKN